MSITVDEGTVGLWFVDLPGNSNWLGGLNKHEGKLKFTYRFRYSSTSDPWDEKDIKNWYEATLSGTAEEAVDKISCIASLLAEKGGGQKYELLRGTATVEQFMDEWAKMPFCHVKVIKDKNQGQESPVEGKS